MKKIILFMIFIVMLVGVSGAISEVTYYNYNDNVLDQWSSNDGTNTNLNYVADFPSFNSSGGGSPKSGSFGSLSKTTTGITIGSGSYSLSIWARRTNLGSSDSELMGTNRDNSWLGFSIWADASDDLMVTQKFDDASQTGATLIHSINDEFWHNVVYVNNGTSLILYYDGINTLTFNYSGKSPQNNQELYIGNRYDLTQHNWVGRIDEFKYWNSALTSDEVELIYAGGSPQIVVTIDAINISPSSSETGVSVLTNLSFRVITGETHIDSLVYFNEVGETPILLYNDTDNNGTIIKLTVAPLNYSQNYSWKIRINDSTQTRWINQSFETTLDTNNPTFNYINWIQPSDGGSFMINGSTIDENFIFNISVSDTESLFSFNITINDSSDIHFQFYTDFIGDTDYNFLNATNLGDFDEESQEVFIEVCDGHTKQEINMDIMTIDGITYFDDIKIHSDFGSITTDYLGDRYNIIFDFDTPKDDIEIEIESPYKIKDLFYSGYEGHVITGDYWIDSDNSQGFEVYDMIFSDDDKKVKIKLASETKSATIKFNSIGKINCENITVFFIADFVIDTVNLSTPAINTSYNVNNSNLSILFNYIPYYLPDNPDNCSIYLNNSFEEIDLSVTKNINNTFNRTVNSPLGNTTDYYNWFVRCNHIHFHPPSYFEQHTKQSMTYTFDVYNVATTSSTTTTTLVDYNPNTNLNTFTSTPQSLFYMFLATLWLGLALMYHSTRGKHGNKMGVIMLGSVGFGIVLGMSLFQFSYMMGITTVLVSVGLGFTMD